MSRFLRSAARHLDGALCLALAMLGTAGTAPAMAQAEQTEGDFGRFVEGLWPEAKARGVSRATFDESFRGVAPDAKIVALTKKQSEFVRPIWEYIDGAVSAQRLERGRQLASEWSETLAAVERTYGVPRSVVLGVWG